MATHENEVRRFAREYQTPATRRLIAAAEAGLITWAQAYKIAADALADGLAALKEEQDV